MARPVAVSKQHMLDVLLEYAPRLLAAGVTSLSIDGLTATLSPPPPKPEQVKPDEIAASHIDPLRDPSTYPGGRVPGFEREGFEDD